jgi:hypothetical protein
MQDKDTSWYNDVFGTGMNIFGGSPGANTQNLIDSGLLKKEAVEKAQNQSLTKGLLTTALSFMANPQNQNYGQGITPYLGKALQAGVTAAQTPFDKLTTIAGQNQKIEEYNDKKAAKLKAQTQEDDFETWKKGIYQPNSSVEKTFMAPGQLDSRIQSTDQSGNTEQIYPDFNNSTQEVEKTVQVPSYDINKHIMSGLASGKIKPEQATAYRDALMGESAVVGDSLVNKLTGEVIYDNKEPQNLTNDWKNYSMTTQTPTTEGFGAYLKDKQTRGGTNVSVNTASEAPMDFVTSQMPENFSKNNEDRWINIQTRSNDADVSNARLQAMKPILDELAKGDWTGSASGFYDKFGSTLSAFGFENKYTKVSELFSALKQFGVKSALGNRKPGSGPMTDKDFEELMKTVMRTENSARQNEMLANVQEWGYKYDTGLNAELNAAQSKYGKKMTNAMFDKVIKEYDTKFREERNKFFEVYLGNAPTDTMDDGTTVKRIG